MNVGPEIQFTGEKAVASAMASEKGDLAAFQRATDVGIGGCAERSSEADLFDFRQAGHGVEPTAADDSDLCAGQ